MGWRDWLRVKPSPRPRPEPKPDSLELERALVPPIYRFPGLRQGLVSTPNQPLASRLMKEGFKSTQATASRAIANRISDIPMHVERLTDVDGMPTWEKEEDHPLLPVLRRPNMLLTHRQMMRVMSYWLTQAGEAFALIVTDGSGQPRELWPMSPAAMEKEVGTDSPVSGWIFHGEQGETRYTVEEVVWIFDPDPDDPFAGLGVVGPQAREFDAQTFASETMRSHFQHDAVPKVVLEADLEAQLPTQEQRDAFWADWQNRYNRRGGEMAGVPAMLPKGFKLQEIAGGSVDDVRAFLEFERDNLLMANGVPRSILGDVVDANRAAADTNRLVFDRHTIKPQAGLIEDAYTLQVAQPTWGESVRVRFEDFIDEDEDFRLREEAQDLALKVRSIDQVRDDRGLDAVEWGDKPVGTFGDQPYDPNEPPPSNPFENNGDGSPDPATEDEGTEDEPEEEEGPERAFTAMRAAPRIMARFTPEAAWMRQLQADAEFIPEMLRQVRRVFAGQKALVLAALEDAPANQRAWSREDWIDAIFAEAEMSRLFDTLVTPVSMDAFQKAGENVLADLEARPSLTFDELAVKQIRDRGADLITQVNATTKRSIRNTLAKGIEAGDSLEEQAARVRRVFNQASRSRARTIARTETGWAIQKGQLFGYDDSQVVESKRWNTALDASVRDSHQINGQVVGKDATFTLLDGETALAPRVSSDGGRLSARNSINCRCFTTPVLEGINS